MANAGMPHVDTPCPIGRAVEIVGDRWTLLILRNATLGRTRFDQFRAELGIADNILANRLARLVENGLMVKVPYRDERRTRHEYRLTEAGADLLPVLHALAAWGGKHTRGVRRGGLIRVIHTSCGSELAPGEFCENCGRPVDRAETAWRLPWGPRAPQPLAEPAA